MYIEEIPNKVEKARESNKGSLQRAYCEYLTYTKRKRVGQKNFQKGVRERSPRENFGDFVINLRILQLIFIEEKKSGKGRGQHETQKFAALYCSNFKDVMYFQNLAKRLPMG